MLDCKVPFFIHCLLVLQMGISIPTWAQDELGMGEEEPLWLQTEAAELQRFQNNLFDERPRLNLNQASALEMSAAWSISLSAASAIVQHRQAYGLFTSPYELQAVFELDSALRRRLIPYAYVGPQPKPIQAGGYTLLRWQRASGNTERYSTHPEDSSAYFGSRDRLLYKLKYRWTSGAQLEFCMEKDPGEAWWRLDPKQGFWGPDYLAVSLKQPLGERSYLILGDYSLFYGQGLVQGRGYIRGRGQSLMLSPLRTERGLEPYSALSENLNYRGLAYHRTFSSWELDAFVSSNRNDASFSEDSSGVSYLYRSGLHRTPSELNRANRLREWFGGLHAHTNNDWGKHGAGLYYHLFQPGLAGSTALHNALDLQGNQLIQAHLHSQSQWENNLLHGALALSNFKGLSATGSILRPLSKKVSALLHLRHYGRHFHSLRSGGFGQRANNQAEQGVYVAADYQLNRSWNSALALDQYRFLWPSFSIPGLPQTGRDLYWNLHYTKGQLLRSTLRLVYSEEREKQASEKTLKSKLYRQLGMAMNLHYQLHKGLHWKNRIQYKQGKAKGNSFLCHQEIRRSLRQWRYALGYMVFRAEDYDLRLFTPEKSLLYQLDFSQLQGSGQRLYAYLGYKAKNGLKIEIKGALTQSLQEEEETEFEPARDWDTELQIQVFYRFD